MFRFLQSFLTSLASFCFLAISLAACDDSGTFFRAGMEPISFESIPLSEGFDIPFAGVGVIRNDSTWQHFCDQYWFSAGFSPPSVDFAQQMVLCVHYGPKGCYPKCVDVIKRVERSSDIIFVTVAALPPDAPCTAVVAPHQMVSIPQSALTVVFVGEVPG